MALFGLMSQESVQCFTFSIHLSRSSLGVCAPLCSDLVLCSGVICGQGESSLTVTFKPGSAVSPALTLIETDGESEAQPQGTSSESAHTHTHLLHLSAKTTITITIAHT